MELHHLWMVLLLRLRLFTGERVTIEKSWMDGSDRSSLTVLSAQAAHSLTADVAARRLYWISDSMKVKFIF
uniref:Uncharacterized protein n=1 Tax=Knipowitschia caucasica TaxID=637954 RepID=A0AAV2IZG9_KNICA